MAGRRQNGEGTIYAYRNGYAAQVFVVTPEGRRVRKTVYGKTKREVQEKWVRLQSQSRRGPVATTVPRLEEFAADWLTDVVKPNLAPSTVANYELFMRLYITPDLGRKRVDRLSVRDVRLWLNELRERCQCCAQGKDKARAKPRCCAAGKCCRQTASEWTVHQAWTVLRSMLSEAMRDELVTRNVAALVKVPMPRPKKPRYWTVDEARRFLESAKANDDPLFAGYVLMLVLGLRRGELLGLGWEDLDLDRGEAHIAWQLQRLGGELVRRRTKTHSSDAPLPLPDICVEALKHRHRVEDELRLAAGEAWSSSGLVLTTRFGDAIDPRNFQRAFRSSVRRAGVPVIPVHSTRRTCASLLVALDVHPRVAMAILRHSKIAVTMDIYSQVSAASTREALKRLGEAFE
ncbi:MAG: site-specific integrase [Intrasporangium sp.]|uniref:tyrosine-type recombinase/integrase n=1 Tax=Intrasporangium sp. TaxID=1925024 RepID=UPI002647760B|nr:tyrosine-type recombinase/integrase [Intrasporangium sp.]MDN5795883.1 site-specific integrase [Intrasporangium sp.]